MTHLLARESTEIQEIVRVIEFDPTLTMKMLRVANSAVSGSRRVIGTVKEAVLRLGTGTVAGFAIGASVRPMLGNSIPGYNLSQSVFWRHSLAAAFAAEALQRGCRQAVSPLAFTAALLHDIGKVVLGSFLSSAMVGLLEQATRDGQKTTFQAESELLAMHHGQVGGLIAKHWKLPDSLMNGIIGHHKPGPDADPIGHVTFLANVVAHRQEAERHLASRSPSQDGDDDVERSLKALGLSAKHLTDACESVHQRLQQVSEQED